MDVRWSVFFSNFVFILPCFFHFTATFKQQGKYLPFSHQGSTQKELALHLLKSTFVLVCFRAAEDIRRRGRRRHDK